MPHPSLGALLATAGLAWLAGVAAQLQQAELWPVASYAVAIALAALATAVAARARSRRLAALLCLPAAAVAGFALTGLNAAWRLADGLAPDLEGRDLIVSGVVADMPQPTSTGVLFRFEIEQASLDAAAVRVPRRVALAWYAARGEQVDATADAPRQPLRAGQRWRLQVRLKQPHGNANPHGFDYELYLFEQGVRASGYVRDGVAPVMLAPASGFVIARWRQSVRDAMLAGVGDARAAGVLAALAVGDQAAIALENDIRDINC